MNIEELNKIIQKRAENQRILCDRKGYPNFVGDGSCNCGHNVFEKYEGKDLVTGCPFCHKTFCD